MAIDFVVIGSLAGGLVVAIVTALLVFVFSPKEVSYEEAIKRQQIIQPSTTTKSVTSNTKVTRKEHGNKKDKIQRKANTVKKKKDKVITSTGSSSTNVSPDDLDSDIPIVSIESADENSTHNDDGKGHTEHVGFKGENLIIEFDRESLPERKRRVSTDEKPKKPILLNKTPEPSTPTLENDDAKPRTNSFDIMQPKDEYELYKSTQLRKSQESLANGGRLTPTVSNGNGFFANEDTLLTSQTVQLSPVTREFVDGKMKMKEKSKAKHKITNSNPLNSLEALSTEKLIETIKSLALDSNEITLLVNELLNKQADGESSWSQKNDPIAPLKKSLAEKEHQLKIEQSNSEAANARVKELRNELQSERSKTRLASEKLERIQGELERLQSNLNQINEKHRTDLSVKNKLVVDQKATINQLQEELASSRETIKNFEVDRETLTRLNLELDSLRGKVSRLPALQASNDELSRECSHLKELVASLQNTKQQDESNSKALQQNINELHAKLAQVESNSSVSHDELNQARNKIIQLEDELRSSRETLNSLQSNSKDSAAKSSAEISSLKNDLTKLQGELEKSTNNVSELTKKLIERDEEIKQLTSQVENKGRELELENQLKVANEELAKLKENLASDSSIKQQVDELTNQVNQLTTEKNSLATALGDAKNTSVKLTDEMSNYFKILSHAYPNVSEKVENESLSTLITELAKEAEVYANAQQSSEQLESLGHKLQEEQEKTRQLQEDVKKLKSSLANTSEALKAIEQKANQEEQTWSSKLSNLAGENEKLKNENQSLRESNGGSSETIKGLESSLSSVKSQLEHLQVELSKEQESKKELTSQLEEVSTHY